MTVVSDISIPFILAGTAGVPYNGFEGALTPDDPKDLGTISWAQTWAIHAVNAKRMLIGTDYLYESHNGGDICTPLGGVGYNKNVEPMPINPVGTVTAYAYGHQHNEDAMYVGT